MTAESGSIRDQLMRLLGRSLTRGAPEASRPAGDRVPAPTPAPEEPKYQSAQDPDWKAGIGPPKTQARVGVIRRASATFVGSRQTPRPVGPERRSPSRGAVVQTATMAQAKPAPGIGKVPAVALSRRPAPAVDKGRERVEPVAQSRRPKNSVEARLPGVPISTTDHFKWPEQWVAAGQTLQPGGPSRKKLAVRIGIDFGTAYTKVAVQAAGKVFFLDWEGLHRNPKPYLLSGEVSAVLDQGSAVGRAPEALSVWSDLKVPFLGIEAAAGTTELARATLYLAWVMRYGRAWVYHHQGSLVRGSELAWEVNLGAPTGVWEKQAPLLRTYARVARAAWQLSQHAQLTLVRAERCFGESSDTQQLHGLETPPCIVPEFAAQVAGFARSPQRTEGGLYLLVDVGAGTLDVACFRIMRNAESGRDWFPVFSSAVEPLGTHYLMNVRDRVCAQGHTSWGSTRDVPDARSYAASLDVPPEHVHRADATFSTLVRDTVWTVLSMTRYKMDPTAKEWRTQMPVFMAGGGARLEPYRSGVEEAFKRLGVKYRILQIPKARAIEARFSLDETACSRMSVAQGLTTDENDIGELIRPMKIGEFGEKSRGSRPDHDDLYTKR